MTSSGSAGRVLASTRAWARREGSSQSIDRKRSTYWRWISTQDQQASTTYSLAGSELGVGGRKLALGIAIKGRPLINADHLVVKLIDLARQHLSVP